MTAEIKEVKISELTQSEYNYREELGNVEALSTNIEGVGMYDEPLVRPTKNGSEAKYEVIDGIHRITAAKENNEEIVEVRVRDDLSDREASQIAISTDVEELKNWRGIKERTKALISHWRLMGGEGEPNATKLAEELNVPRSTISYWLETARNEWENTPIHAEFVENETSGDGPHLSINVDDVGDRTLSEIRRTINYADEDIDEGVKLAKEVEQDNLTRSDIKEIRKLVKEENMSLDKAQAEVMLEEEEEQETEQQTESEDEIPDGWETEPEPEQTQNDTKSAKPEQKQSESQSMEPQVQNPDLDLGGATMEDISKSRGINPEKYAKAAMEQEKENIEALQDPEIQENIAIFENHGAHKIIMTVIGDLRCPICGEGSECLQWSCGDHEPISVKEATDMTEDILKDNVGGE